MTITADFTTTRAVSSLTIAASAGSNAAVIYSLPFTGLTGDIVHISSAWGMTYTQYVGMGCYGLFNASNTVVSGTSESIFVPLQTAHDYTPPGGSDHAWRVWSQVYKLSANFSGYLNLVGYVYNGSVHGSTVAVIDTGHLSYLQISPDADPFDTAGLATLIANDVTAAKTPNEIFTDMANYLSSGSATLGNVNWTPLLMDC